MKQWNYQAVMEQSAMPENEDSLYKRKQGMSQRGDQN